ncbi:Pnap_2097 family protein [Jannaschia sp. M317]|uniref:Pnap_2097 family protein n=1 Tax=Jannaschia sp. M317 TaxID=2867011 RepID=UPI0021A62394|nr:Pnap_2097 family protein [Jannaschia sp. M317]UWQ17464.1 hypothetical protein K3551_16530 [Jannaschia sp. M317]
MAHLAPRGISEDWWLKHLGDVHWQLIADAVGQHTTVFRDAQGRQLYAAFCATEVTQAQPDLAGLGEGLEVQSALWAAGRSRIQSNHRLLSKGREVATFRLVSTFVAHMQAGLNASVRRATPYLIPVLDPAPDDFAATASAQAKARRSEARNSGSGVTLRTQAGTDFNAVGLLYFPSYTRLIEQTEATVGSRSAWTPIKRRQVLYFGNIELDEPVFGTQSTDQSGGFDLWTAGKAATDRSILATCQVARH